LRDIFPRLIFLFSDLFILFFSIIVAYYLRYYLSGFFTAEEAYTLSNYTTFYPLYFITILLLAYEGIYTHRYDFWHESRVIVKSLFFSLLMLLAYLAITKSVQNYSRAVIIFSFVIMVFLLPIAKLFIKKRLYKLGLWRRRAKVYSHNLFLQNEIFGNYYLGYIDAKERTPKTVFINSQTEELDTLKNIINKELRARHEVIFIPLIDSYDLTHSHIYSLSNTRTNLIVLKNRLKSKYQLYFKTLSDTLLLFIVFPIILPLLAIITYRIYRSEPSEPVFFKQKRMGKNQNTFVCYKFRTMTENSSALLHDYLLEHPEELENYQKYHKYKNDPRITPMGHFLRRTSLDELPQIFNVLRGEMSFIGPRPYIIEEKDDMGDNISTILAVKPGITGLWQVSGRSDIDFLERIELDVWYIHNWNLWMDLTILLKTIRTVLSRDGAS